VDRIYCLPIIATKTSEIEALIERTSSHFALFELWLDYLNDFSMPVLSTLIEKYERRTLFLFRRQNLETPKMEKSLRLEAIKLLAGSNAIVDLDLTTQQEELSFYHSLKGRAKLVTSYHNYSSTPDSAALNQIVITMKRHNSYIIKIACYCSNEGDAVRLLDLTLRLRESSEKFIVLGMGDKGRVTRVCGALWGNAFNFAPLTDDGASAPGQLTINRLETILELLE